MRKKGLMVLLAVCIIAQLLTGGSRVKAAEAGVSEQWKQEHSGYEPMYGVLVEAEDEETGELPPVYMSAQE